MSGSGFVFISAEFKLLLHQNGIQHSTCVPYHPATNALAEKTSCQTFKEFIKKKQLQDNNNNYFSLSPPVSILHYTQEFPQLNYCWVPVNIHFWIWPFQVLAL